MSTPARCAFAACSRQARGRQDGWLFCAFHIRVHKAIVGTGPWPKASALRDRDVVGLAPCGTPAAARRHVRRGEPLCETCRVAGIARRAPDTARWSA